MPANYKVFAGRRNVVISEGFVFGLAGTVGSCVDKMLEGEPVSMGANPNARRLRRRRAARARAPASSRAAMIASLPDRLSSTGRVATSGGRISRIASSPRGRSSPRVASRAGRTTSRAPWTASPTARTSPRSGRRSTTATRRRWTSSRLRTSRRCSSSPRRAPFTRSWASVRR